MLPPEIAEKLKSKLERLPPLIQEEYHRDRGKLLDEIEAALEAFDRYGYLELLHHASTKWIQRRVSQMRLDLLIEQDDLIHQVFLNVRDRVALGKIRLVDWEEEKPIFKNLRCNKGQEYQWEVIKSLKAYLRQSIQNDLNRLWRRQKKNNFATARLQDKSALFWEQEIEGYSDADYTELSERLDALPLVVKRLVMLRSQGLCYREIVTILEGEELGIKKEEWARKTYERTLKRFRTNF